MEMVLLDWTRMGRSYCFAGAVWHDGRYRIVRPLLAKKRAADLRNVGWSAHLLDGHARWEIFELLGSEKAPPQPPHLEDLWVRALRPLCHFAAVGVRREILLGTMVQHEEQLFGTPLSNTGSLAYLQPGTGTRSLVTITAQANQIVFSGSVRVGAAEPDLRVSLPIPGLGERYLLVKDHHLLQRAERSSSTIDGQLRVIITLVSQMGELLAVRLGLSRSFQSGSSSRTRSPASTLSPLRPFPTRFA